MAFLFGFHAVLARGKLAPSSIEQVLFDQARKDKRMQQAIDRLQKAGVKCVAVEAQRLDELLQHRKHQGLVAFASVLQQANSLEEIIAEQGQNLLLLILDSVTDPHNLGACLRSADAAGAHAVVLPKDKSVGITPVVSKVACGAAESMPVFFVTNLARTLKDIQKQGVWCLGAAGQGETSLYQLDLKQGPLAWVMGAEGQGLRRLTQENCDQLVSIPMQGSVESLNVSVATAVCLFETSRQKLTVTEQL